MPVNLSIKNVPDEIALKLKERAERNHRSLQGELMSIVQEAASLATLDLRETATQEQPPKTISIREAHERMRALGVRTAGDSVEIIRKMRDERYGR
jgi:antitoxin FitA